MISGPLHNRDADGLPEACGQPFPCSTGIAIYEAVKRELEAKPEERMASIKPDDLRAQPPQD